jgi:hypothetical protein
LNWALIGGMALTRYGSTRKKLDLEDTTKALGTPNKVI